MATFPAKLDSADGFDKVRFPAILKLPSEDRVLRAEKNWISPEEPDCIVKTPFPPVVNERLELWEPTEIIGFIPRKDDVSPIVVFPRLSTVNLAIPLEDALMSGPISF